MKRIGIMSSLLLAATTLFAQEGVTIKGLLTKDKPFPVHLFKVQDGKPVALAQTTVGKGGKFGFTLYPDYEGLYLIGTGTERSPIDNYKFWLKAGDQLSLVLEDNGYQLTGSQNSKENQVLTDWYQFTKPIEQKAVYFMRNRSTYVDFFPALEETVAKAKGWASGRKTGNATFDRQLNWLMRQDLAFYATTMLNTPRAAHPDIDELSPYYATISAKELFKQTADVYQYPWGVRSFGSQLMLDMRTHNVPFKPGIEGYRAMLPLIANDTLKGDYILGRMGNIKDYGEYKQVVDELGRYFLTQAQKDRSFAMMTPLLALKPGDAGYNFTYPDKNGKMVSFADLKGKVVLIDVWATWCGPCKAEIPHLKKLEEEMKGTDVQIVSISVDEAKDKEKWLQMIKDENLGGMQLFATGWGEIAKYYKINGIPRFMVFDREGKIVTIDSPRPSDPALKALLEKTLAL